MDRIENGKILCLKKVTWSPSESTGGDGQKSHRQNKQNRWGLCREARATGEGGSLLRLWKRLLLLHHTAPRLAKKVGEGFCLPTQNVIVAFMSPYQCFKTSLF